MTITVCIWHCLSYYPLLTGLMHIVDVGSYWIESDTHGNLTAKREFWNYPDTTWVPPGVMQSVSFISRAA